MESFKNEVINLAVLPRYQETELLSISSSYWRVLQFNFAIHFLIYASIIGLFFNIKEELINPYLWIILSTFIIIMTPIYFALKIGFRKRGYAIRTHDLIYRRGILSINTIIIPFNRIQHVAVNEGFLSRYYGLAQLQIFTAGGASSDMRISGLSKIDAEKIKETILFRISNRKSETIDLNRD